MSLQSEFAEHRIAGDIQRYRTNALRLDSWLKLLRGNVDMVELSRVLSRRLRSMAMAPLRGVARILGIPPRDDLPAELRSIVANGIKLCFVFADSDPGQELLNSLGGSTARRLVDQGTIRVRIITGADHTFTDRQARTELVQVLVNSLSDL
jgi:hypothetical protein